MDREELRKGRGGSGSGRGAGRLEAAELLKIGRQTRVVLFRVVPRAANRARPIWNSISPPNHLL
jgi:hypothetical protein